MSVPPRAESSTEITGQLEPLIDPRLRLRALALQFQLFARWPLASYTRDWIRRIDDITPFVREQHEVLKRDGKAALVTPLERVYPVTGMNQLGVDRVDGN